MMGCVGPAFWHLTWQRSAQKPAGQETHPAPGRAPTLTQQVTHKIDLQVALTIIFFQFKFFFLVKVLKK